ncbi:unnamed protein product [Withania somnifera]
MAQASDPDMLCDFIVPAGSAIDGNLFTFNCTPELLFVVQGSLEVEFVNATNKLYTKTRQVGDLFVFPKGLVHYQYNSDWNNSATAVSAFGSANAGTVSLPKTLFSRGIDDQVLAKSFKSDIATIQKNKAGLSP